MPTWTVVMRNRKDDIGKLAKVEADTSEEAGVKIERDYPASRFYRDSALYCSTDRGVDAKPAAFEIPEPTNGCRHPGRVKRYYPTNKNQIEPGSRDD